MVPSSSAGTLNETHSNALKLGYVDPNQGDALLCVARIIAPWFAETDAYIRALAPPDSQSDTLFDDFYNARVRNIEAGMKQDKAHNKAVKQVNFRDRYHQHLQGDEQKAAMNKIIKTLESGTNVWLVCYANTDKVLCHREILKELVIEESTIKLN
jgi:Protein of unknown function, DUF488.